MPGACHPALLAETDELTRREAVNWAVRQIGKRNRRLNRAAVAAARRIARQGTGPARWIASDALRELTAQKTHARLKE